MQVPKSWVISGGCILCALFMSCSDTSNEPRTAGACVTAGVDAVAAFKNRSRKAVDEQACASVCDELLARSRDWRGQTGRVMTVGDVVEMLGDPDYTNALGDIGYILKRRMGAETILEIKVTTNGVCEALLGTRIR